MITPEDQQDSLVLNVLLYHIIFIGSVENQNIYQNLLKTELFAK